MDKNIKKLLIFAYIVSFLLILIYRSNINYKDNNNIVPKRSESTLALNDFSGVTMTVESADDTKITVRINNSADEPMMFGEYYILEVKDSQKWYSLPFNDNIMFTSIGYGINKGDSKQWSTDFEILYGRLSAGQYRIIKSISPELQRETSKQYFISAEFSIS